MRVRLIQLASLPCIVGVICVPGVPGTGTGAPTTPVYAFPSPSTRFAAPGTQIAFRGLTVRQLGSITVTGSRSGTHLGRLVPDSDNHGGSFIPNAPFTP